MFLHSYTRSNFNCDFYQFLLTLCLASAFQVSFCFFCLFFDFANAHETSKTHILFLGIFVEFTLGALHMPIVKTQNA